MFVNAGLSSWAPETKPDVDEAALRALGLTPKFAPPQQQDPTPDCNSISSQGKSEYALAAAEDFLEAAEQQNNQEWVDRVNGGNDTIKNN